MSEHHPNDHAGRAGALLSRLKEAIAERVVGKSAAIELVLAALLAEGHVLLEDVPGTGKTLLARTLAERIGLAFRRIQFTPDLLPSDITGSSIYNQHESRFEFRPGPLFAQVVLADEINRAAPRTQSALLEAMEERQVTADGLSMPLTRPFLVIATQNPLELEGTFPLPEAQLDRFLVQLRLGYPEEDEECAILARDGAASGPAAAALDVEELRFLQRHAAAVHVSEVVRRYIVTLVRATRSDAQLALGGGPRASLALHRTGRALAAVRGRAYVLPDDVKELLVPVLGHRVMLTAEARLRGAAPHDILRALCDALPAPVEDPPPVARA